MDWRVLQEASGGRFGGGEAVVGSEPSEERRRQKLPESGKIAFSDCLVTRGGSERKGER
jgi:hypothetical protein